MRLADAASIFCHQPHQIAAFNALEEVLSSEILAEFFETFNAAPPPKLCPSTAQHKQSQMEVT